MTTSMIVALSLDVICFIVIIAQCIWKKASIWVLPCVIWLFVFAGLSVFLLNDMGFTCREGYEEGLKRGLDSNISMKYVLITDSLYKKK